MSDVLIVVPTYEEHENIEPLIRSIRRVEPDAAVLVVDDGSPDGTAELAEAVGAEVGGVHLLRRPRKDGLGGAYRAGFTWARLQGHGVVVQMDADLSHDPADLPLLLSAIRAGADLAVGSRYVPGGEIVGWPASRRALSRLGNLYATGLLGLGVKDATSGFRAWRRPLLDALASHGVRADGYGFQVEMAYRAQSLGAEIAEVPIRFVDRQRGASKLDGGIVGEAASLVARLAIRRWRGLDSDPEPRASFAISTSTSSVEG